MPAVLRPHWAVLSEQTGPDRDVRPHLPCPWAAALLKSGGAWLLTWLFGPGGECGRPALPRTLLPLHDVLQEVDSP